MNIRQQLRTWLKVVVIALAGPVGAAELDLAGTWTLKVYDQGASHPTASTPDGTLVKEESGLPFISQPEGGVSAVGLYATGNANGASSVEDAGQALFDNLKVYEAPRGACVIFR